MNLINELTDAINEVNSVIDAMKELGTEINTVEYADVPQVALPLDSFFDLFEPLYYDIEVNGDEVTLSNEYEGVNYFTRTKRISVECRMNRRAEHYKYIAEAIDEMGR